MPIRTDQVFIGPALSCANLADEQFGMRVPRDLASYFHLYRQSLSVPYYFIELQPERRWVEQFGDDFVPKSDNSWWQHFGTNNEFRFELACQPHIIGVHSPIEKIDVLTGNYNNFKKRQSIASIKESMEYANAIGADYFIFHLIQQDDWVDLRTRWHELVPESYRIYAYFADYYRKRNFHFVPCIEILEFPKYPATSMEAEDMLHDCQGILPGTKLVFDLSHLWRSRNIIIENKDREDFRSFDNVFGVSFLDELKDTLALLGRNDIYCFHLGGCYEMGTHGVPGINPNEDPLNSNYRLDCLPCSYDLNYEMDISGALEIIIDFCSSRNQDLKMILEIHNQPYSVILRAMQEMKQAVRNKIRRRC